MEPTNEVKRLAAKAMSSYLEELMPGRVPTQQAIYDITEHMTPEALDAWLRWGRSDPERFLPYLTPPS